MGGRSGQWRVGDSSGPGWPGWHPGDGDEGRDRRGGMRGHPRDAGCVHAGRYRPGRACCRGQPSRRVRRLPGGTGGAGVPAGPASQHACLRCDQDDPGHSGGPGRQMAAGRDAPAARARCRAPQAPHVASRGGSSGIGGCGGDHRRSGGCVRGAAFACPEYGGRGVAVAGCGSWQQSGHGGGGDGEVPAAAVGRGAGGAGERDCPRDTMCGAGHRPRWAGSSGWLGRPACRCRFVVSGLRAVFCVPCPRLRRQHGSRPGPGERSCPVTAPVVALAAGKAGGSPGSGPAALRRCCSRWGCCPRVAPAPTGGHGRADGTARRHPGDGSKARRGGTLASAYLAAAEPANHRLDGEVDGFTDHEHGDLAAAEADLRAEARRSGVLTGSCA